jgi:hypothetical protein
MPIAGHPDLKSRQLVASTFGELSFVEYQRFALFYGSGFSVQTEAGIMPR